MPFSRVPPRKDAPKQRSAEDQWGEYHRKREEQKKNKPHGPVVIGGSTSRALRAAQAKRRGAQSTRTRTTNAIKTARSRSR